jgi:hypothetical protein
MRACLQHKIILKTSCYRLTIVTSSILSPGIAEYSCLGFNLRSEMDSTGWTALKLAGGKLHHDHDMLSV